jgi:hypothetical protein
MALIVTQYDREFQIVTFVLGAGSAFAWGGLAIWIKARRKKPGA